MRIIGVSDEELLKDLASGNETAFLTIYDKYWYRIFSVAYKRLRNKEVSEELTQDLFLKLWEKRAHLKVQKLENFLIVSIKNAVIDHIHSGIVANKYVEFYNAFVATENNSTQDIVNFHELSAAIETGLKKLPVKSQEVFRLSRLDSWPAEKIAQRLQLSEKTVGYHLTKSLKFMRAYLREHTLFCLMFFCG